MPATSVGREKPKYVYCSYFAYFLPYSLLQCSGDHPVCERCVSRGLICCYSGAGRESRVRRLESLPLLEIQWDATASLSPAGGGVERQDPVKAWPSNDLDSRRSQRYAPPLSGHTRERVQEYLEGNTTHLIDDTMGLSQHVLDGTLGLHETLIYPSDRWSWQRSWDESVMNFQLNSSLGSDVSSSASSEPMGLEGHSFTSGRISGMDRSLPLYCWGQIDVATDPAVRGGSSFAFVYPRLIFAFI